ncbi:hypothetical protein QBC37DRAFT_393554 [Rhypophila decipiens]|uniref:Uncharacterized protein n=1 Tax=Rhypophila decipiens TaxID=261697 RepID=A0AAN6XTF5_9PEZI|nr:hypothetical protein QBC37DRAFT_393554 [Rhypophila decipiens]
MNFRNGNTVPWFKLFLSPDIIHVDFNLPFLPSQMTDFLNHADGVKELVSVIVVSIIMITLLTFAISTFHWLARCFYRLVVRLLLPPWDPSEPSTTPSTAKGITPPEARQDHPVRGQEQAPPLASNRRIAVFNINLPLNHGIRRTSGCSHCGAGHRQASLAIDADQVNDLDYYSDAEVVQQLERRSEFTKLT